MLSTVPTTPQTKARAGSASFRTWNCVARGLLEFLLRRQGTKATFIFIELLVPCVFHMDVRTYSGIYPKVILNVSVAVNPLTGCVTEWLIRLTVFSNV